jgi:SAM-dependent methyltransferase
MPTSYATIRSYNLNAAQWANLQKSRKHYTHEHLEKPAMHKLLPNFESKKVLCVGCGSGEECDFFAQKGAITTGVDISSELVSIAKMQFPNISFDTMDMEQLNFETGTFDILFSSLTIHYSDNQKKVFQEIFRVLKPGGECVFSMQHPVKWGSETTRTKESNQFILGYKKSKSILGEYKVFGDYLTERKVKDTLFGTIEVEYFHRPISAIMMDVISAGFEIIEVAEPKPTQNNTQIPKDFVEVYSKIPLFILFKIRKPLV